MSKISMRPVAILLCLGFLSGCGAEASQPRTAGIVRSHVDAYRSGTGSSSDLVHGKQMASGFHYGDGKKTDWNSEIHWSLIGHQSDRDVYRFTWLFAPSGVSLIAQNRDVAYDGRESVIVFQNDSETVSIEPGSMP
jgi:hypothetical protein